MSKIGRRILMVAAAGAAMLATTPANAWYAYTYTYANGSVAGGRIYCDDGTLVYSEGVVTQYYTVDYHWGEPPC